MDIATGNKYKFSLEHKVKLRITIIHGTKHSNIWRNCYLQNFKIFAGGTHKKSIEAKTGTMRQRKLTKIFLTKINWKSKSFSLIARVLLKIFKNVWVRRGGGNLTPHSFFPLVGIALMEEKFLSRDWYVTFLTLTRWYGINVIKIFLFTVI